MALGETGTLERGQTQQRAGGRVFGVKEGGPGPAPPSGPAPHRVCEQPGKEGASVKCEKLPYIIQRLKIVLDFHVSTWGDVFNMLLNAKRKLRSKGSL